MDGAAAPSDGPPRSPWTGGGAVAPAEADAEADVTSGDEGTVTTTVTTEDEHELDEEEDEDDVQDAAPAAPATSSAPVAAHPTSTPPSPDRPMTGYFQPNPHAPPLAAPTAAPSQPHAAPTAAVEPSPGGTPRRLGHALHGGSGGGGSMFMHLPQVRPGRLQRTFSGARVALRVPDDEFSVASDAETTLRTPVSATAAQAYRRRAPITFLVTSPVTDAPASEAADTVPAAGTVEARPASNPAAGSSPPLPPTSPAPSIVRTPVSRTASPLRRTVTEAPKGVDLAAVDAGKAASRQSLRAQRSVPGLDFLPLLESATPNFCEVPASAILAGPGAAGPVPLADAVTNSTVELNVVTIAGGDGSSSNDGAVRRGDGDYSESLGGNSQGHGDNSEGQGTGHNNEGQGGG